ncbi:sigma-70 family RNA polymerase sigma factor (plasmid) [Streptomyces sp. NBC_01717]|uniref:sigma-70 family RNA polymerase sigma factor n=1 Tax=Streptomyces sp. NBC_01717 TaxID=2975918 RepID=UPI002E328748|nr:sigma-70 family RNA polymerase sigma factor [Streptomyces sp. NBC_01717]
MTTALLTRRNAGRHDTPLRDTTHPPTATPTTHRAHTAPAQRTATAAQMESIVELHGSALHRFCLSLTRGDRWRAEEITQETLIRAWKHPNALDASREFESFRPWLFTVARRIAIDADRARRVRPPECNDAVLTLIPEPEHGYDRLLVAELIHKALASLTAEQQAVIHCLYFRSLTGLETAKELGLPLGTVKSRTHYAIKTLKHALKEAGFAK